MKGSGLDVLVEAAFGIMNELGKAWVGAMIWEHSVRC